ncbi:MAG: hypothetical protein H6577_06105 [Lewinellaceae bacterium]|nr:hypothetical protein [Saprospiraceae bacterium]MCB9337680.1 hypothetical protein [Lewinellaceae bacterium]
MNRALKRTGIGIGATLLLLVLGLVVVAGFFQEAVGRKLIKEINKQLTTELKVGSFDLSLLRGFPNATASLRDVVVTGKFGEGLLEAKTMDFHFRLLSLFGSNVIVHSVTIRDGALNARIDKGGKTNYDIFKPSDSEGESNFSISLEKARLENIELAYRNDKLKQEMMAQVEDADFSGRFSSKQFDMASTATLVSNFIDIDGTRYLPGKHGSYDANIFMDLEKGTYDFKKMKLKVEDNVYNVEGTIKTLKNYTEYDLTADAEDANLESVIALLPAEQLKAFGDFTSTGQFQLKAFINGKWSASEQPSIEFQFGLENGKLNSPRLKEPFKDVSFEAHFTNGEERNSKNSIFEISDFKGYLNRELITMSLKIEDMDDPLVDFQADGALPVGYMYGLLGNPAITDGDGEIEIRNLKVRGFYSDMIAIGSIATVDMSGEINFDDASLKINGEKMIVDRGLLIFQNNQMTLEGLKIDGAGSEIDLQGQAQNLLPVLLADSLNSKNARLDFNIELASPQMDLARLVNLANVPVDSNDVQPQVYDSLHVAKNEKQARITDLMKGVFKAKVDKFSYHKIEGQDFVGSLVFENSQMKIEGNAKGMDGAFKLDGTMFFEKEHRLEAKLDGTHIDVQEFFRQSENFGQEQLTSDNIEGTMNTKMLINAFWDSTGTFLTDELHVWAGVGIQNGRLKGFKLLEEFSTYADVKDLRDVRFVDLQNWIEVKNSTVYLPAMFIQNNAMNMTVSGEQTFDDKIDYNIKVNAGQVIANKFKKRNKADIIPAKQNGFFNLYFNLHGTLDKYDYETNKKKVKDKFAKSESQKQRIRAALIRAFGAPLNMLREPKGWEDEGEVVPVQNDDDDVEYIPGF